MIIASVHRWMARFERFISASWYVISLQDTVNHDITSGSSRSVVDEYCLQPNKVLSSEQTFI